METYDFGWSHPPLNNIYNFLAGNDDRSKTVPGIDPGGVEGASPPPRSAPETGPHRQSFPKPVCIHYTPSSNFLTPVTEQHSNVRFPDSYRRFRALSVELRQYVGCSLPGTPTWLGTYNSCTILFFVNFSRSVYTFLNQCIFGSEVAG